MKSVHWGLALSLLVASGAQAIDGDINADGVVDLTDFFMLADNFGRTGEPEECGEAAPGTPITLSGTGTQVTAKFTLKAGLNVARAEFLEEGNFFVELLDGTTGERVEFLFIEGAGTTSASTAFSIEAEGEFILKVETDGAWTITIE